MPLRLAAGRPGRGGRLVYRPVAACRRLPVLALSGREEINTGAGVGVSAGLAVGSGGRSSLLVEVIGQRVELCPKPAE